VEHSPTVSSFLRQRREQLGCSLSALAAAIPTTPERLRQVELGRTTLPPGLAARLALVLELNPYDARVYLGVNLLRSWATSLLPPIEMEARR